MTPSRHRFDPFATDGTPLPAAQGRATGDHEQEPDPDWHPL
ncbi:MAG TPA: hypothetical protein VFR91_06750 [Dyella sp.]|nr:hypothetical protein [Dyella sp.]